MRFRDSTLSSVLVVFPTREFDAVALAVADKYGQPTAVETIPKQNAVGARYVNSSRRWVRKDGGIVLNRYAGNVNNGSLLFVTEADAKAFEAQKSINADQRKRDM